MTPSAVPASAPLSLRGVTFAPALFCAPMAGITHSAFRRLLGDYGGYGALWTEMLSARHILEEDLVRSPWLKRRPHEGKVVYQLLVCDVHRLEEAVDRLAALEPDALDLNIACPAPGIRRQRGGADLFDDAPRLRAIVGVLRRRFAGPLMVKMRLGRQRPDWRETLRDRMKLLEDEGVDALTVHPRHTEEKLKRSARHVLCAELAAMTRLPVIASGDITGLDYAVRNAAALAPAAGLMIGRMAAAQPWVFAKWQNPGLAVDHAAVWQRLCDYIVEDFPADQALVRIRTVAPYFARNFVFGHTFRSRVCAAPDIPSARARAAEFLAASPPLDPHVAVGGI